MRTALRIAACLSIPLFAFLLPAPAQTLTALQQQAIVLKRMIETNHVSPRPVDDQFSKDLFDHFLEDLDPGHMYLTQADIGSLETYRVALDDELNKRGWSFIPGITSLLKKRLLQADSLIVQLAQKPFDFTTAGNLPAGFDSLRAKNDTEWKDRWAKRLKYEVLDGLTDIASGQLERSGTVKKADVLGKEPEIRNRVKTRYGQKIKNLLSNGGLELKITNTYLSALAMCFDPHTDFFDTRAKQDFEASLNTEGYFFGFSLGDNEKNEVSITRLVPGSSAWKSGQLNKGDVLLQLQWQGKAPVDLSSATAEDVNKWIGESGSSKLSLTVRKADGSVVTVALQKEKIENDEQFVKSFILSGKRKIGYIYLPGFYSDWEDASGSSCAADMAKEIVKLKKEGIEGIILDVRFNGGGSLQEAIELAGIFIDEGPLCQIKDRTGKISTLKDMNRGTIWDGPLLMMVNGQSASASELVAAALQDYNRAIIAGSVTFGKATGQEVVPVDTLQKSSANPAYGFAKITGIRLYRVTGKTAQGTGVQPDVVLPGLSDDDWHESGLPFSLKADTVKRNQYYRPLAPIALEGLRQGSAARLAASEKFSHLKAWQKVMQSGEDEATPLHWDEVERSLVSDFTFRQAEEKIFHRNTTAFEVTNHSFDKAVLQVASFSLETNKQWLERLSRDASLEESYLILSDYIQNTTK